MSAYLNIVINKLIGNGKFLYKSFIGHLFIFIGQGIVLFLRKIIESNHD